MRSATPTTNGVAMLVPLKATVPVVVPARAEVTDTPGAETSGLMRPSKVGPRLEKEACLNPFTPRSAIAPTVSASTAAPGEPTVQRPGPAFPAATPTTIPPPRRR